MLASVLTAIDGWFRSTRMQLGKPSAIELFASLVID